MEVFDKVAERVNCQWIKVIANTRDLKSDLMGNERLHYRYLLIDVPKVFSFNVNINVL